jgi:hypothetical protein
MIFADYVDIGISFYDNILNLFYHVQFNNIRITNKDNTELLYFVFHKLAYRYYHNYYDPILKKHTEFINYINISYNIFDKECRHVFNSFIANDIIYHNYQYIKYKDVYIEK